MTSERTKRLADLALFYREQLLENCLPCWVEHLPDRECGGYRTCLCRDWSVYDDDKLCMWCSGRIVWMFSFLYNELEKKEEWLQLAADGVDFIKKYGFAPDGTMYYALARDGRPLVPARDVFVELFTVTGFSEFARARGDDKLYERARELFMSVWDRLKRPGDAFQPFIADTRPVRRHGHSMGPLITLQELRRTREDPAYETMINECIHNITTLHMRPEHKALLEIVTWDGNPAPGSMGRWINPGHMIESGIFIIHEGQRRSDRRLIEKGVTLIDWGFEWGWDKEFGGIYNDVDLKGLPAPSGRDFVGEKKLWWQHAEALYGLLLAYSVTDDEKYMKAYELTHDYSFSRFADPEHGEWFAVLDRRGNIINDAKGTARKSPFHIPRNFYFCYRLLEKMTAAG